MSSLVVNQLDVNKIENVTFEDFKDIQIIKMALQQQDQDLLIYVRQAQTPKTFSPKKSDTTLLTAGPEVKVAEDSEPILIAPKGQENSISLLFRNMSPVTLTGLLVTLFLGIFLFVAIKCLYDVKTNDQFGRSNLWVGKQS